MTNYELKQGILDKLEIEGLIERIQKLEHELAARELEVKLLKKELDPFLESANKRKEYLERRDMIDEKINKMLYNL